MIECIKYILINKKTCLGLATIFVEKWGIEIAGISLHQKDGKRWVNFPTRMYEEKGEKKYYPYFRFRDKGHQDRFMQAVKDAVDKHIEGNKNKSASCEKKVFL